MSTTNSVVGEYVTTTDKKKKTAILKASCCSKFTKEGVSVVVQFIFGVIPACVYAPVMDMWERQNLYSQPTYREYKAIHFFTRYVIIFISIFNWGWIFFNWRWSDPSDKNRRWRQFNRMCGIVLAGLISLNDRQLDRALSPELGEKYGYTKKYYRDILLGCMIMQLLAIFAYCLTAEPSERKPKNNNSA